MSDAAEVRCRIEGRVGRITLNRPQAIHALTTNMIALMTEALVAWRDDPAVELVLLDHSGERGFCAGGDIRMLAESGAGDGRLAREFFFTEYRLNHLLVTYPKPTVVFMDGIVMGGGVGLSLPCTIRVATERTTFAMPETGIGLFPDVGGGWHLSRLPDETGLWLALTGARLKAADCEHLGIVTDVVSAKSLPWLRAAIVHTPDAVTSMLEAFNGLSGTPPLLERRKAIAELFAADSVAEIFRRLAASDSHWAHEQLIILAGKSPQTMEVAFRQLRLGAKAQDFAENMAMEYRIASRVVHRHDFLEGVRAVIVDKDNAPRWQPARLQDVTSSEIDAIFAPLPDNEEWTPLEMDGR